MFKSTSMICRINLKSVLDMTFQQNFMEVRIKCDLRVRTLKLFTFFMRKILFMMYRS